MQIETRFSVGDMVLAVPPKRRKEVTCEVLGVSVAVHRKWYADRNRVETITRYTLKYRSGISEHEIFRTAEENVRKTVEDRKNGL